MHDHAEYRISNLPEPEPSRELRFRVGDDHYLIKPEADKFWLYLDRPEIKKMSPLVTFNRLPNGTWSAAEVNGFDHWEADTHTEMLRKVLAH
jgi:hypothetical protein